MESGKTSPSYADEHDVENVEALKSCINMKMVSIGALMRNMSKEDT